MLATPDPAQAAEGHGPMTDPRRESGRAPRGAGDFIPATTELLYERHGAAAFLTFNRPSARNAMSWAMYEGLYDLCEHVDADDRVRVLVLRGAGDKAFVAGTDISQFQSFSTANDALAYERNLSRYLGRLEAVRKPTIAMIRGYCVGGGALIAAACDLRVASPDVRFGVPIARTLGNILSAHSFSRLVALLGPARTKEILFTARLIEATEGSAIGLFNEIVDKDRIEEHTLELANRIAEHAPLTLRATKEAVHRILDHASPEDFDDLVLLCYLSGDFKEGVAAFLDKRTPRWTGR
jgi:enoyl-CoA hydratase/carnithine racemase